VQSAKWKINEFYRVEELIFCLFIAKKIEGRTYELSESIG